jgi:hypothetical protein
MCASIDKRGVAHKNPFRECNPRDRGPRVKSQEISGRSKPLIAFISLSPRRYQQNPTINCTLISPPILSQPPPAALHQNPVPAQTMRPRTQGSTSQQPIMVKAVRSSTIALMTVKQPAQPGSSLNDRSFSTFLESNRQKIPQVNPTAQPTATGAALWVTSPAKMPNATAAQPINCTA